MPILNETLVFVREPAYVQAAFEGKAARRVLLPAGTDLYKFTAFGVVPTRPGASYSPWWAAVTPLGGTPDPGLDGHIDAAKKAGLTMIDYARDRFAVMLGWNALGDVQLGVARVVRIKLSEQVYGFGGLCQRMREDVPPGLGTVNVNKSPLNPPIFMGGAYQYYIPNLTAAHVRPGSTHLIP